jgi:Zn-finger protein
VKGPAACRLIVQPCEEDDEDDELFFCFYISMEHRWNEIDRRKPKYSEKNLSQCHFVHHKSQMD